MNLANVLIDGRWRPASASGDFAAVNPTTGEPITDQRYPISRWSDIDAALAAAAQAADAMRALPGVRFANFLEHYANLIEAAAVDLVACAHQETGLAVRPRLAEVELPRTVLQLRLAADAARHCAWQQPTIDSKLDIRSCLAPLGPVWVFGPNNFPFAFNSIAGGDFAAAIAAGNPVIAKAHPSHPGVTLMLAELAFAAVEETKLPLAAVQLIYAMSNADGQRAVADPRTGAAAFTGGRPSGLALKQAADAAGKPIYLEMSSVNPVVMLPGALEERLDAVVNEFATSCLMGCGQFCTNPGLVLLVQNAASEEFIRQVAARFESAPAGVLLSKSVQEHLAASLAALTQAGAKLVARGPAEGAGFRQASTLLRATGAEFLARPAEFQTEAFGPVALVVVAANIDELAAIIRRLEGNLTGSIYSGAGSADAPAYERLAPPLRARVGRLLNDKMPTGVAVSPAMQHGGPYPATGHPGFTAVGIPASLRRFAGLECYDAVRDGRLPLLLQNGNPLGSCRLVDGKWTTAQLV